MAAAAGAAAHVFPKSAGHTSEAVYVTLTTIPHVLARLPTPRSLAVKAVFARQDVVRRILSFLPAIEALSSQAVCKSLRLSVQTLRPALERAVFFYSRRRAFVSVLAAVEDDKPSSEHAELNRRRQLYSLSGLRLALLAARELRGGGSYQPLDTGAHASNTHRPSLPSVRSPWGQLDEIQRAQQRAFQRVRADLPSTTWFVFAAIVQLLLSLVGPGMVGLALPGGATILQSQCQQQTAVALQAGSIDFALNWAMELGIDRTQIITTTSSNVSIPEAINIKAFQLLSCGLRTDDDLLPDLQPSAAVVPGLITLVIYLQLSSVVQAFQLRAAWRLVSLAGCHRCGTIASRYAPLLLRTWSSTARGRSTMMIAWSLRGLFVSMWVPSVVFNLQMDPTTAAIAAVLLFILGCQSIVDALVGLWSELINWQSPGGTLGLVLPASAISRCTAMAPNWRKHPHAVRQFVIHKVLACLSSALVGYAYLAWFWALCQPWKGSQIVFTRHITLLGPIHANLGGDGLLVAGITHTVGAVGMILCLPIAATYNRLMWAAPRRAMSSEVLFQTISLLCIASALPIASLGIRLAVESAVASSPSAGRLSSGRSSDSLTAMAATFASMTCMCCAGQCVGWIIEQVQVSFASVRLPERNNNAEDDAADSAMAEYRRFRRARKQQQMVAELAAISLLAVHRAWNLAVRDWKLRLGS